jgi:foldase protein PrsA
MRKEHKTFILGFLSAIILTGTTIFANNATQIIEVLFNSVDIVVEGEDIKLDNIVYEGTTYVPLRAIFEEIVGKKVTWDAETSTVIIGGGDTAGVSGEEVVASVNGTDIKFDEFEFYLNDTKAGMEQQALKSNISNLWETEIEGKNAVDVLKEKAVDMVVLNTVQLQKAQELGLELDESELAQLDEEKKYYINMWGGEENYESVLTQMGLNDKTFAEVLQNMRLSEKLRSHIMLSDGYTISDEEKKEFYDKNKDMFYQPQVTAKHILIGIMGENGEELSDKEIEEKKKLAETILTKIEKGEDFDKLMNEYSDDPGLETQPDGYTFSKGQMVPEFEEAAFSLENDKVSGIVETTYGYHIIKKIGSTEYAPYDMVSDWIESNITYSKYNDLLQEWKAASDISIDYNVLGAINIK